MIVKKIEKQDWALISSQAHLVVFGMNFDSAKERIDFALAAEAGGALCAYVTCRESDSETLYWQYGGMFPNIKGTIKSLSAVKSFIRWSKEAGYKRICYYVENTNRAMLKMALMCGFTITGVRNYSGSVLVEHLLEF